MALEAKSIIELHSSATGELRLSPRRLTWLAGTPREGKEDVWRWLSLAETPPLGEVLLEQQETAALTPEERLEWRTRRLGFVAASPFLIPTFSAIENIAVPLMKILRPSLESAQERIAKLLRFVGLEELVETPAAQLDPVDQARLVLARALAHGPLALFVEPLETILPACATARFADLLRQGATEFDVAVVVLEGDRSLAWPGDRRVEVRAGRIAREEIVAAA